VVPTYNLVQGVWLPVILLAAVSLDDQSSGRAAPYVAASLGHGRASLTTGMDVPYRRNDRDEHPG
jgi:hypothetical protein